MKLEDFREELDSLDSKMLELYQQRINIVKEIAQIKKESNLPIFDKKREEEIINKSLKNIDDENLKAMYKEFIELILKQSKEIQKNALNRHF